MRLISTVFFSLVPGKVLFAQEIRDIRPPVSYPANWLLVTLAVLIIASVVAALSWFLYKRKMEKQKNEAIPQKSAWDIAYEQLRHLQKQKLLDQVDQIKKKYQTLSNEYQKNKNKNSIPLK